MLPFRSKSGFSLIAGVVVIACGSTLLPACGTERPETGAVRADLLPSSCGTASEGCPCATPGESIACGSVERRSGDYVTCSMGYRTCQGNSWGSCNGTVLTTKSISPGLQVLGLATVPSACTDPCDPYCKQFADNPDGGVFAGDSGLKVLDGALTIDPAAAAVPTTMSSAFTSNGGGVTNCSPDRNIVGTSAARACTPPGLSTCQQDFRCDPNTNTCLWNAGPGYADATCTGIDLTVGAPCGLSGSAPPSLPLCNRGTGTLPSGSIVTLHETNGSSPPDACTDLGTPTCTYVTTFALAAGSCTTLTYCQNSPGSKFISVNAGIPGQPVAAGGPLVTECSNAPAGQRCQNNGAYMKTDGSTCGLCQTCNTTLSGKVYDPSGASSLSAAEKPATGANDVPLPGVQVFQPTAALTPLIDGVACDTCASLATPYMTGDVTDATGSFLINQVSPGASGTIPIVVQSGRWRRKINITTADLVNGTAGIIQCVDNPVKPGKLRLPRSRSLADDNPGAQSGVVSDMPKIALVMGNRESLECGILKYGVHPSEMAKRTASTDTHRIQLYSNVGAAGMTTASGLPPAASGIWGTGGSLNEYAALIVPCSIEMKDAAAAYAPAADKARLAAWTSSGGRMFMDHWAGEAFIHNMGAPFSTTTTWASTLPTAALATARAMVLATTTAQIQLRDWLGNVGGSSDWGSGWMRSDEPWNHALNPTAGITTQWLRGLSTYVPMTGTQWSGTPAGDYALSYSFEVGKSGGATVVGATSADVSCGGAGGTGRVIYNGMHVSQARAPGGAYPTTSMTFPTSCVTSAALTSEEKALEFQFFQLTACQLGGAPPPPPPPPPPALPTAVVYRDYQAACAVGFKPVWRYFYWQSVNPTARTQIQFRVATAASASALPTTLLPAPATIAIGTATTTVPAGPAPAPQWGSSALTVEEELTAQGAGTSQDILRVFLAFVPDNTVSPVKAPSLINWRQTYDCVPNE